MAMLLGDVGGTNARLALARDGVIDSATVTRFPGKDFASFDDVVRLFLQQQGRPDIASACIAAAGPVSGGRARLTNRDWDISQDGLARLTGAGHVRLINDLTALGHAIPVLRGEGLASLRAAPPDRDRNGQALVVGMGTGFNTCAIRRLPGGGIATMAAELGHSHLPANIHLRLADLLGARAAHGFATVEDMFSGRSLPRFHAARTGSAPIPGERIAAAADAGDPEATATYEIFTELAGLLCRELALHFMPLEGMFLAGGVGRSIAARFPRFEAGFLSEPFMRHIPQSTPVLLIQDDMAALHGCMGALSQGAESA